MKYNQLQVTAAKTKRRVGRGISAGQGKTAGRGTKGQKARTGASKRPGFEGGQNPLLQRLPKLKGFRSHRLPMETVSLDEIQTLSGVIGNETLAEAKLVTSSYVRVKLLAGRNESKKLSVKLQAASQSAITALEKAGGSFTSVEQIGRTKTAKAKKATK